MRCEVLDGIKSGRGRVHRGEGGYSRIYTGYRAWGELDAGSPGARRVGEVCGGCRLMINYSTMNEGGSVGPSHEWVVGLLTRRLCWSSTNEGTDFTSCEGELKVGNAPPSAVALYLVC